MLYRTFRFFVIASLITIGFSPVQANQNIPFNKLCDEAEKRSGDKKHSITELWNGYRLDCRMQDLQAEITMSGTRIQSTSESEGQGVFSIRAAGIGRESFKKELPVAAEWVNSTDGVISAKHGGVVEEYKTSGDGIRQDFVIIGKPGGKGKLVLEISVEGANLTLTKYGIQVRMISSRELVYHDLEVFDAAGKKLEASFEMTEEHNLKILVDDKSAKYPVRINPTISDADWVSMGGVPGIDGVVYALEIDSTGNLYAGGEFNVAGNVAANNIAKWDGTAWSALGSGMKYAIYALICDNTGNLYAGGDFDTTDGIAAYSISKWNGSAWSILGSGMNGCMNDLVFDSSGNLYACGDFKMAGGRPANHIAKWNGSAWNALGSGINYSVITLAIDSSGNLYAGGAFDTAGGVPAKNIAKWDGNTWSTLGSEIDNPFNKGIIRDIAIDGFGHLFAGGEFYNNDKNTKNVARWDGNTWSPLHSGMNFSSESIDALAIDGNGNLYAGGYFISAGDIAVSNIAKWKDNKWNSLGSGTNGNVETLVIDSSGNLSRQNSFWLFLLWINS
ncbi:MAG: hypothetical protein Q8908_05350 [Bacteroidota bacterium]|nr:hypothetical protein [Bacteroidota bacterium]